MHIYNDSKSCVFNFLHAFETMIVILNDSPLCKYGKKGCYIILSFVEPTGLLMLYLKDTLRFSLFDHLFGLISEHCCGLSVVFGIQG